MHILFQRLKDFFGSKRRGRSRAPEPVVLSLRHWLPLDSIPRGDLPPRYIPTEWLSIPRRLWRYQPRPRINLLGRPAEETPDLRLLVEIVGGSLGGPRIGASAAVSLAIHVAGTLWLLSQPLGPQLSEEEFQLALRYRDPTPLVAPSPELLRELTGTAPAVREVTLGGLLTPPGSPTISASEPAAVPAVEAAPEPAPEPAPPPPPKSAPKPIPPAEQPPEMARAKPPRLVLPTPAPAPTEPASPSEEAKPQIAFESVGPTTFSRPSGRPSGGLSASTGAGGSVIPPPPSSSVQEAIREMARSGGGGPGLVIGDVESTSGVLEARQLPPSPNNTGSNIQMLNDPQGVDFRPYLIRVLASVRRNWFSVIPASAKLGRGGRVVIQFSIDKSGNVPKLVIAVPSGTEPLDRAAVAGISASNPFPPLPDGYAKDEIRLQLNFTYGIRR